MGSERQSGYSYRSRDFDEGYSHGYDTAMSPFHDDRDYGYPLPRSPPPSRYGMGPSCFMGCVCVCNLMLPVHPFLFFLQVFTMDSEATKRTIGTREGGPLLPGDWGSGKGCLSEM